MRVCFVCNEYPPGPHGGIGTFTQMLARALVQVGHRVRVVGAYPSRYPAPVYHEDEGVAVWRLRRPPCHLGSVLARLRVLQTVIHWSRNGEIDLVEVPDWEGWAAGWPRLRVPIVARLHGSASYFAAETGEPVRRTTVLLERASLRRADFWCSTSRYVATTTQELFRLPADPRAILYNPVEVPAESPGRHRSRNQVVFTGRLIPRKGIVPLVEAWHRVLESNPEAELHVFGRDGPTYSGGSMHAFLRSRLSGRPRTTTFFHGHVPRTTLFQALRAARVAVFPSYAEAFAIAPLEAMVSGCPTIFTRRTSGPELIDHERTGLLVDPDSPDDIADAIIRLLTDDELAARLGDAGQERVRSSFSIGELVNQNQAFYQSCVREFGRLARTAP